MSKKMKSSKNKEEEPKKTKKIPLKFLKKKNIKVYCKEERKDLRVSYDFLVALDSKVGAIIDSAIENLEKNTVTLDEEALKEAPSTESDN